MSSNAFVRCPPLAASLAALALLSGCASGSYVVLLDNPDGTTGEVIVRGKHGEQLIQNAGTGVPLDGSEQPKEISREMLQQDFAAARAARPLLPEHFLLYFESSGVRLTPESAALLPKVIEAAAKRRIADVSIIGHTDTVGKAEGNARLALERAEAIGQTLVAQGIATDHLSIESHGESNLLIKTPDETSEPKNRRVEISIR